MRGGKRPGAGRKPAPSRKAITVRVKPDTAKRFADHCKASNKSQSSTFADLVDLFTNTCIERKRIMSCNHRKFSRDEVLRWIKDMRFDNPWFCATSGNTLIIERANRSGSTVYEFTWNNSKTPIDDPQLTESAWSLDITEADIPDTKFYADDKTEAAIEEVEAEE